LPETEVNVSLEGKTAEFKDVASDKLAQIIEALTKAGFPATLAN